MSISGTIQESQPAPNQVKIFAESSGQNVVMLYTRARFYRTAFNSNIVLALSLGNNFVPTQWYSTDGVLPINAFNSTKPITEVSFPSNNSVQINHAMKFHHSIQIEYSLAKDAYGNGYENFRKIQCIPVKADNTVYDNNLIAYKQPGPNNRDIMLIQGDIDHAAGDIIKLRFNVVQDNGFNGQSTTYLTIYSVAWNLSGLKALT